MGKNMTVLDKVEAGGEGGVYLGVAQRKVGLLEEDVHMNTPYIQLPVPLCWHHMALWHCPVSLTPCLHTTPTFDLNTLLGRRLECVV